METAARIKMNTAMSQITEFARSAVSAQPAPELPLHALVVVLPYFSTIMTVFHNAHHLNGEIITLEAVMRLAKILTNSGMSRTIEFVKPVMKIV